MENCKICGKTYNLIKYDTEFICDDCEKNISLCYDALNRKKLNDELHKPLTDKEKRQRIKMILIYCGLGAVIGIILLLSSIN